MVNLASHPAGDTNPYNPLKTKIIFFVPTMGRTSVAIHGKQKTGFVHSSKGGEIGIIGPDYPSISFRLHAAGTWLTCLLKTKPFGIGVFRVFSLRLGGTGDEEGIEILGRASRRSY